jgi:DNA-binding transcriptional MerR regulator
MKIAELSKQTGCSVPTIKYYLREGLLPRGVRTAANQADYRDEHVHRLRLIRALLDIGNLPIATVRAVLDAIEDTTKSTHDVLGVAHYALAMRSAEHSRDDLSDDVVDEIDGFLGMLGWEVKPNAPAKAELARALVTMRRLGWIVEANVFDFLRDAVDEGRRFDSIVLDPPSFAKNKEATEEVARAADDLAVVHAVLDTKITTGASERDVERAVAETKKVEERLGESAEKLEEVNETLEREVRKAG